MREKRKLVILSAILIIAIFFSSGIFSTIIINMNNNNTTNNNVTYKTLNTINTTKNYYPTSQNVTFPNTIPVYSDNFTSDTTGVAPSGWNVTGTDVDGMFFEVVAGHATDSHNPFSAKSLFIEDNQDDNHLDGVYTLTNYVTEGMLSFNVSASVSGSLNTSVILEDKSGTNLIKIEFINVGTSGWEYVIGNKASKEFSNYEIVNLKIQFHYDALSIYQNNTIQSSFSPTEYTKGVIQRIQILSTNLSSGNELYFDNLNLSTILAQPVSLDNFIGETPGNEPFGWYPISGVNASQYMAFNVVGVGGQNPFSTNALAVVDSQYKYSINANYNLSEIYTGFLREGLTNGAFEFDLSASVTPLCTMDTSIILQDISGNNLIKFELKNVGTSGWEYVIGSYTSSTFSNLEICDMKLEFIEGSLNVYQNNSLVASNLLYTKGFIQNIHIDTGNNSICGNSVFIDHFNIFTYPDWLQVEAGFQMNALTDQQTFNYDGYSYSLSTGFNVLRRHLLDDWGDFSYKNGQFYFYSLAHLSGTTNFTNTKNGYLGEKIVYNHFIRLGQTSMFVTIQYPGGYNYMELDPLQYQEFAVSYYGNSPNGYIDNFNSVQMVNLVSDLSSTYANLETDTGSILDTMSALYDYGIYNSNNPNKVCGFYGDNNANVLNITWHSADKCSTTTAPDGASTDLGFNLYMDPTFTNSNAGTGYYIISVSYSYEIIDFCQMRSTGNSIIPGIAEDNTLIGTFTHTSTFQLYLAD